MIELTDSIRKRFEIQLKKIYIGNSKLKNGRPVLNQIHYSKDGHVEITNSHVGVRLSNVHDKEDSDETYPNLDFIFEISDKSKDLKIDSKIAKQLEDQLNTIYRNKVEVVRIKINSKGIFIEPTDADEPTFVESGITVPFDTNEEISFGVNSRNLHDALMMIRLMGLREITFYKEENTLKPLSIVSKNLHYVIMPVRLTR